MGMRFPAEASWLEIDARALAHNAAVFREVLGPAVRLGGVLKGNAYGHGLAEALPHAHAACDALYVIEARDALAVRAMEAKSQAARRQVLVLGAIDGEEAVELAQAQVEVALTDPGQARFVPALRAAKARLRGHVHVDTGLGREGFTVPELPKALEWLAQARDAIEVAGVLSHFANTEDVTEQSYAAQQLAAFEEGAKRVREARGSLPAPLERHIAASAAALLLPQARQDVVRVGISLYGLWPSSETRLSARALLGRVPELRPVLSWRCRSQLTKWLPAGSYVGYGCTYRCPVDTRIAVLPMGYWDGYPRLLSSRAHALVNGQRCPVLGRVMMNHVVIDVTRAARGEGPVTATLLGRDGDEQVSADQLAVWAQTINYEIVTRIGAHLRRVLI
ncbi:MAG TPA: alanine racemase [Myxococcales bacterium]|nr:alanine racemase [Myxococcales bacterium]